MDLTFINDMKKQQIPILGICEHHSRMTFALSHLKDKSTISILRVVLDSIDQYGKPKIIRTDNEVVFTSRLFRLAMKVLGIQHQTTELHSPWQNGRIESLFGTLKNKLSQTSISSSNEFYSRLLELKLWYNHARKHQNLNYQTPASVWFEIKQ